MLKLASAAIWEHLPLSNKPNNTSARCSTSKDTESAVAGSPNKRAQTARSRRRDLVALLTKADFRYSEKWSAKVKTVSMSCPKELLADDNKTIARE
jgi:hypothetical protein